LGSRCRNSRNLSAFTARKPEVRHPDALPGHPGGQPVVEPVGQPSTDTGLGAIAAGADHHVEALLQPFQQARDGHRIVLAVGVPEHDHLAGSTTRPALDRPAIAQVVGMPDHLGPGGARRGLRRDRLGAQRIEQDTPILLRDILPRQNLNQDQVVEA